MAEIKIAPKRRFNVLPWILGLVLLALVILGAASAAHRHAAAPVHRPGAAAVDNQWDNIPPKLRQYA
ncbi:MAG: hypothetical protein ACJ76Y_21780 [Thermoanaerobaculia bacterium]